MVCAAGRVEPASVAAFPRRQAERTVRPYRSGQATPADGGKRSSAANTSRAWFQPSPVAMDSVVRSAPMGGAHNPIQGNRVGAVSTRTGKKKGCICATMSDSIKDKLEAIFSMQQDLNSIIGEKHGIGPVTRPQNATADERIEWILKFNKALMKESNELDDCYVWKWWADDQGAFDWQNARVELVDMLHFLVSACIMAGLGPDDVFELYEQKWRVNLERQRAGYAVSTKTEDDNKDIALPSSQLE